MEKTATTMTYQERIDAIEALVKVCQMDMLPMEIHAYAVDKIKELMKGL